ncbi:MAG: UbiA family prenyltransferase [Candidatus Thorarchaeota archaeon]
MPQRVLLFRNLIDNIPKNIGLYSVGVMLLLLLRISINLLSMLLGLLAFLVSYSSIYVLNDLYDAEDDKKDERKVPRKPLAQGVVNRNETKAIFVSFLIPGLLLSILLNPLFFFVVCLLVFINLIYSLPLVGTKNRSSEEIGSQSLKHTIVGLPLVFLMQFLKILLPWTTIPEILHFPALFAIGFSVVYIILFRGYKEYLTIGESIVKAPFLFCASIMIFIISMSMYPEPFLQASMVTFILVGIIFFRNSHLTDRRVLLVSPWYILLGIIFLVFLISNI